MKLLMLGLKSNTKPNLRRLKFKLQSEQDLEKWTDTWLLVDEALSVMVLKDPLLIIKLPPLQDGWKYDSEQRRALEKAYLEGSLGKLKSVLYQTA
ncbi:hypothetical protein C0991_004523, partial [Blastosporella zonata]